MKTIGLMVTPGKGYYELDVDPSATLESLIRSENLSNGRTITADGREIAPNEFASIKLSSIDEIWATGGAKGA